MAYFHCRARIWIRNWTQIPVLCRYYGKWIRIWIWVSGNMFCIILCSHRVWNPSLSPNLNPSPAVEITDYTTTEELTSRSPRPSWSRPSPTRGRWLGWRTRAQWDTDTYFSFSSSILIPSFSHERTLAGLEDTLLHVITSSCPAHGFLGLVLIDRDFGGTEGNIKKEKLKFRWIHPEGNFQQEKSNFGGSEGNFKQKKKLWGNQRKF